jgi:recombination protein RecA
MASLARADLESLLRARKLDRTLTSTHAPDPLAMAATGLATVDAQLAGGFPRGQVSEIVGPRSSGRTSLLLQTLAAATARGELVALVDALDTLDVESATAAGIDLARLLWIRGHVVANPGMCGDTNQRAIEQTIKALTLVLQAGNIGLVAFDAADAPREAIRRLPFTTWLRLQRIVEGSQTTCVLVGTESMARSAAGLSVKLSASVRNPGGAALSSDKRGEGSGDGNGEGIGEGSGAQVMSSRMFQGLDIGLQVVCARGHLREGVRVSLSTRASVHV